MINYYLYYRADDSIYGFDTRDNRRSFRNKNKKKGTPVLFEVHRYDVVEDGKKSTPITLYMEDEEEDPLGYLTSFVATHTQNGIVAEWGKFESTPWNRKSKHYPSIDDCLKDYIPTRTK
ncbi:hypothetical protein [Sporosarcina sp. Marseille-Q4943]|uniref:hypothetical protein n=1 Tax=Sporosarcina sp. Marseille-Q4943 TaxID=2942204 RepID=UPI00208DD13D|nr:hypothetical protein [Sporosarcina sp. Marseille-Q4943]